MRVLFTCFLVHALLYCLTFNGHSQELNQTDAQGRKQGKWLKRYDNNKIRYTGQFIDDKPVGEFKYFNEDGELSSVISNKGDSAKATFYHVNGTVLGEGKYHRQKRTGIWKHYDADGDISSQEVYENGVKNGPARIYYKDGRVAKDLSYDKGKVEGKVTEYFPDGKPKQESHYEAGKLEGMVKHYKTNGKIWIKGYYTDNVRDKVWVYYKPEGGIERFEIYELGTLKASKSPEEMETYREQIKNEGN